MICGRAALDFRSHHPASRVLPFKEFTTYLMSRKWYWLLPLIVFVCALAALIYLGQRRTSLAPFVYSLTVEPARSIA